MGRLAACFIVIAAIALLEGCGLAPRNFRKITHPAPLVRARAMSLGSGQPDSAVLPALVKGLGDKDPVVRLAAHEELKSRTGRDFGYQPWGTTDNAQPRWLAGGLGSRGPPPEELYRGPLHRALSEVTCRVKDLVNDHNFENDRAGLAVLAGPVAWLGGGVIGVVSYLGGLALLLLSAGTSLLSFARDDEVPEFWGAMKHELSCILMAGLPLVGLVHVGMGSFLSMQAYFGSTFVDGTGAVVGVGLLHNLATLMTGLTLSGLLAGRMIPELLRLKRRESLDRTDDRVSRGGASRPPAAPAAGSPELGRYAAPRMAAAASRGLALALGFGVGTVIGWQSAGSLLGLPSEMYFMMLYQMVWFRDVVGMIVKGSLFGLIIATVCCFEGLRGWRHPGAGCCRRNRSSRGA